MSKQLLDCGDNACAFDGAGAGGMRTNGGCRCLEGLGHRQAGRVRRYIARLREAEAEAVAVVLNNEGQIERLRSRVAELEHVLERRGKRAAQLYEMLSGVHPGGLGPVATKMALDIALTLRREWKETAAVRTLDGE